MRSTINYQIYYDIIYTTREKDLLFGEHASENNDDRSPAVAVAEPVVTDDFYELHDLFDNFHDLY